jgi:hypothetical protein
MSHPGTNCQWMFALAIVVGINGTLAWSQAASPGYQGPGRYEIQNAASGKFLDLSRQDQRTVVQWPRSHAQTQLWDIEDARNGYVYVKSAATGMVMDIDGGRARDGARVVTSQPAGRDSQVWKIEGEGGKRRFTSRLGIALDLPHGSHDDGAEYQTWSGAGQDNQRFLLWWVSGPVVQPPGFNPSGRMDGMDEGKRAYARGYRAGVEDYKAGLRRTFARHMSEFDSRSQVDFIEGYYDGYDGTRSDAGAGPRDDRNLYEDAFRLGQKDYREGREPNYGRYSGQFTSQTEQVFRKGYQDGYYSAR